MEVLDLTNLNLKDVKTIYKRNNYYFAYKNSKLKVKLQNIGISKLENNIYTNKIHIKLRLDDFQKNKLIDLEDHVYGNLKIKPIEYKSIINGNILDAKIVERYNKFEVDIFDENDRLISISELQDENIADVDVELRNIWRLNLNGNTKYGIIVAATKIALRRNN